jgi:hypothetical protein
MLQIHSADGFGTFLFYEAAVSSASDGTLSIEYIFHHPNKYAEGTATLQPMEKPMKTPKIPHTDSIAELARFWDTHDLTDFEDE